MQSMNKDSPVSWNRREQNFIQVTVTQISWATSSCRTVWRVRVWSNSSWVIPQLPMTEFAEALLAQMGALQPETVIVDLRHNTGGNSEVIKPLLSALSQLMDAGSVVYALIGPETFSSGVMNALDLRRIGAVLVGEATGGVMGFGELKSLPVGDRMTLYCSSKDFSDGVWPHEPVVPDVFVPQRAEDFVRGIDSAIAWIRDQK